MKQTLGVNYMRHENLEQIRYAPGELPDGSIPDFTDLRVRWQTIKGHVDKLRDVVRRIVSCACQGNPRGDRTVEEKVPELAKHVLPPSGFTGLLLPEVDPTFVADELLSSIPWEMFAEVFYQCQEDPIHIQLDIQGSREAEEGFCSRCRGQMVRQEEKLGIARVVSHVVRPIEPAVRTDGSTFLMILDPLGDLCLQQNDPEEICRRSIRELRDLLSRYFTVTILSGAQARADEVVRHIGRQDLAGIYYFGHGRAPEKGGEGMLVLEDDLPLFAWDIRDASPCAPLVFVNACWSADVGGTWTLEKKFESAAHAFAQGPAKTVVGSQWPVVSTQAAHYALEFFSAMLEDGQTVGEALRTVRRKSLERYNHGDADTAWMSYRLFGDADRRLGRDGVTTVGAAAEACPLFDAEGRLDLEAFAFPVESVLLRAVGRRNFQKRAHVSVEDFVAGMLCKGDLMRLACSGGRGNPDGLYKHLCRTNVGPNDPLPERQRQAGSEERETDFSLWDVRQRKDYEPELIHLFAAACNQARARQLQGPLEQQVTERDLIDVCLQHRSDGWHWLERLEPHLPPAIEVRAYLDRAVGREVDGNGCPILDDLDDNARQVIETAHVFAQQRGARPIPTRLLLAAFLADKTSLAWKACERLGLAPDDLRLLMIAITEGKTPRTFALSHTVCKHAVEPMVRQARKLAAAEGREGVDEARLFCGLVQVVGRDFKRLLREPPLQFDLDAVAGEVQQLGAGGEQIRPRGVAMGEPDGGGGPGESRPNTIAPDHDARRPARRRRRSSGERISSRDFEDPAWEFLREAQRLAEVQKAAAIYSPHLFAALIGDGPTPVAEALRSQHVDPQDFKRRVLKLAPRDHSAHRASPGLSITEHVGAIMRGAVRVARSAGREKAAAEDLVQSFFHDGGGVVGDLFVRLKLKLPLPTPRSIAIRRDENVRFTVYGPEVVLPEKWYPMLAFAHLTERPAGAGPDEPHPVEEVKRQAERTLGRNLDDYLASSLPSLKAIPRKGVITFVPHVPGIVFNPPQQSFLWLESVHRQDFRFRASAEKDGRTARGQLTVYLEGTILADIPLCIRVDRRVACKPEAPPVEQASVSPYRKVFASYCHRDSAVVEECERYASALGDEYLRDCTHLRAGEEWGPRLEEMIREADVFQLFWSSNSMHSEYVRQEWQFAQSLNRPHFIRPAYWEDPFPACPEQHLPPADLRELHFQRLTLSGNGCLTPASDPPAEASPEEPGGTAANGPAETAPGSPARPAGDQADVPSQRALDFDPAALADLEERLNRHIVGQQVAVRTIAEAMRHGRQDSDREHQPWCALLCIGPSGAGKTFSGETLAEEVFGAPEALIRLDMSRFADPQALDRLLGRPSNRPENQEDVSLVDRLRIRPYSLVLFDQIEAAHPTVLSRVTTLLSEGAIIDARGNAVDACHAIVVLTCNIAVPRATSPPEAGLESLLKQHLPTRLIEEVDAIVPFRGLAREALEQIANRMLDELAARIERLNGVALDFGPNVLPWLVEQAVRDSNGARSLRGAIDSHVAERLGDLLRRQTAVRRVRVNAGETIRLTTIE